jgi:hypothetical protein
VGYTKNPSPRVESDGAVRGPEGAVVGVGVGAPVGVPEAKDPPELGANPIDERGAENRLSVIFPKFPLEMLPYKSTNEERFP